MENEKVINDFLTLFEEITYDWPNHYVGDRFIPEIYVSNEGHKYLTINKLTICNKGYFEYKGQYTDFNAQLLWPKIEQFVRLFKITEAEEILYGSE